MVSNWVNIARALKGLYDLSFSQEPFYVNSRTESRDDLKHCIAQFQAALDEPPIEIPPLIRQPFKIMLFFLLALVLVSIILGGRQ
jgi:hypothetical protein